MNIRPLYDRIVVKRIDEKETTRHGIIIPDSAQEKPQEGEVIAAGGLAGLADGAGEVAAADGLAVVCANAFETMRGSAMIAPANKTRSVMRQDPT